MVNIPESKDLDVFAEISAFVVLVISLFLMTALEVFADDLSSRKIIAIAYFIGGSVVFLWYQVYLNYGVEEIE